MVEFTLDPRLEADTHLVADLSRGKLLLFDTVQFPWLVFVPNQANIVEINDLTLTDYLLVQEDIYALSAKMREFFKADKMNIATLGNMVPQLHFHIVARKKNDVSFPNPVWGNFQKKPYEQAELSKMLTICRSFI